MGLEIKYRTGHLVKSEYQVNNIYFCKIECPIICAIFYPATQPQPPNLEPWELQTVWAITISLDSSGRWESSLRCAHWYNYSGHHHFQGNGLSLCILTHTELISFRKRNNKNDWVAVYCWAVSVNSRVAITWFIAFCWVRSCLPLPSSAEPFSPAGALVKLLVLQSPQRGWHGFKELWSSLQTHPGQWAMQFST